MQIFDTIYKKENMLQCKFSDNFIHPDYLGTEFPLGYHLINAIVLDVLQVEKYYKFKCLITEPEKLWGSIEQIEE